MDDVVGVVVTAVVDTVAGVVVTAVVDTVAGVVGTVLVAAVSALATGSASAGSSPTMATTTIAAAVARRAGIAPKDERRQRNLPRRGVGLLAPTSSGGCGMSRLIRMDQTGHTTVAEWSAEDRGRFAAAAAAFEAELARGYLAVVSLGEGQAEQVRELPIDAPLVILRRPIAGG